MPLAGTPSRTSARQLDIGSRQAVARRCPAPSGRRVHHRRGSERRTDRTAPVPAPRSAPTRDLTTNARVTAPRSRPHAADHSTEGDVLSAKCRVPSAVRCQVLVLVLSAAGLPSRLGGRQVPALRCTSALQHFGTSALRHFSCSTIAPMSPGQAIPYADIDTVFLDVGNTLISIDFAWVAAELGARGVADRHRGAPARGGGRPPGLLASAVRRRRAGGHGSVSRVSGGADRAAAGAAHVVAGASSTRSSPTCDRCFDPTAAPACCGAA